MALIWDYDIKKLKKTASGRLLILERMINYGPDKGEKIKLSLVKKYWNRLRLRNVKIKKLLELLIWGKVITTENYITPQERLGLDNDEWFAYCIKRGFKPFLE